MKTVKKFDINNEEIYIKDDVARHNILIGESVEVYVSKLGSDTQSGLTSLTPVKTWSRVLEIMSNLTTEDGEQPRYSGQFTVYIMDETTLEIDSEINGQSAPHFVPYNSDCSVVFTWTDGKTTSVDSRFYSARVHFGTSSGKYRLSIDATGYGLYFENCTVGFYHCDVKCPIAIYGGSHQLRNCNFKPTKVGWWGYPSCVLLGYSSGYCRDCSFDGSYYLADFSGDIKGVYMQQMSSTRYYNAQSFTNCDVGIYVEHSTADIDVTCTTNNCTYVLQSGKGSEVRLTTAFWNSYQDVCNLISTTNVLIGGNFLNAAGGIKGSTKNLGTIIASGCYNQDSGQVYIYVPFGKGAYITTNTKATITCTACQIFGSSSNRTIGGFTKECYLNSAYGGFVILDIGGLDFQGLTAYMTDVTIKYS